MGCSNHALCIDWEQKKCTRPVLAIEGALKYKCISFYDCEVEAAAEATGTDTMSAKAADSVSIVAVDFDQEDIARALKSACCISSTVVSESAAGVGQGGGGVEGS